MMRALSCCGCFVVVDEEQETVHFSHHSIHQYLLSDVSDSSLAGYHVNLLVAEKQAGEACVAYLYFDTFDRRVTKASAPGTRIVDIPGAITHHLTPQERLMTRLTALNLLRNDVKERKKLDRQQLNELVRKQFESAAYQAPLQHYFFRYASKWWLWHTQHLYYKEKHLWNKWCRLLSDETGKLEKTWVAEWPGYGLDRTVLEWAIRLNHIALIEHMILSERSFDPGKISLVDTAVMALWRNGQWDFIHKFLGTLSGN